MLTYDLSEHAIADLEQIIGYIAQDSPANAKRVAEKLTELFGKIAEHPGVGHSREELRRPDLLVTTVYSYLVIYDPNTKPLSILRIIHGARDLANIGPLEPA